MPAARHCATCGVVLPDDAPDGQCPECLLGLGLEAGHSPDAAPPDPFTGPLLRSFGDYKLLEEIAHGGMGVVYKARQVSLNRLVAVKMILAGHFASRETIARFRQEAEAAAKLKHPNIVAIHEIGEHEGQHYFTMDYVAGQNLAQATRDRPLPPREAAGVVRIVAEAIQFAHDHGVLHRDVKPSNILLDAEGRPHVTDFGLAKQMLSGEWGLESGANGDGPTQKRDFSVAPSSGRSALVTPQSALTLTGQMLGSPNYISPEQASGQRGGVGPASDVYALGAVLCHLLTGRAPYVGDTVADILKQVLENDPLSPRLLNPAVARDLETICLKCLEKEPARRYVSAKALADDLGRFLRDEPIHARPASRWEKAWRWCRRKPVVAGLTAGMVLLLLAVSIGSPIALYRINQQRLRADGEARRAQQEQTRAEEQARIARRESYANIMLLAQVSLELSDLGHVQELLEKSLAAGLAASNAPWEWRRLQYETRDEATTVLAGCTKSIHGMAVSLDDQWLAAGTTGGQVLLWHLPTRTLRAEWFTSNTVEHLSFSPDGQKLAVGSREATVQLLAVPSGKMLAQFRERGRILELRFLTGGRSLFFSSDVGHSYVDLGGSNEIHRFLLERSWRTAISPDLRVLAAAKVPQGLSIYRDGTNIVFKDVVTPQYHGTGAAISPDGLWFALGLADHSVEIWSLKEPRRVRRLVGHTADVYALAWSADSRLLASGGDDQVLTVWNVSDWSVLRRLQGHRGGIRVIAFSQDGSMLYSGGGDRTVRIFKSWDMKPPVDRLHFPNVAGHAQLAAGARFGYAKLHQSGSVFFQTSPELRFLDAPPAVERLAIGAIAPDGASVFSECDVTIPDGISRVSRCAFWRQTPSGFVRQKQLEHPFQSIRGNPAYSPDGRRVAMLGAEGSLSVWQVEPWRELRRWKAAGKSSEARILFDSTGNRVAAQIRERGIFSGEIDTGRTIEIPPNGITMAGIALSADNRFLAIAGDPATIWEMVPEQEPKRIFTFPVFRMYAASVALTRDGRRLAIGCGDGQIQIWSFPDLMKVGVLKGHQQTVWTLEFRDDDTLVSASPDEVRLWRVAQ